MKVKLTSDWTDFGHLHKCGSVVDVSDVDGAKLVAAGHIQVHPDTPAKINPEMYGLGCVVFQTILYPKPQRHSQKQIKNKIWHPLG